MVESCPSLVVTNAGLVVSPKLLEQSTLIVGLLPDVIDLLQGEKNPAVIEVTLAVGVLVISQQVLERSIIETIDLLNNSTREARAKASTSIKTIAVSILGKTKASRSANVKRSVQPSLKGRDEKIEGHLTIVQ